MVHSITTRSSTRAKTQSSKDRALGRALAPKHKTKTHPAIYAALLLRDKKDYFYDALFEQAHPSCPKIGR